MPLQAIAINRFDASIMRQITHPAELKTRIDALYQPTAHFADSTEMTAIFERAFARGGLMYVGMFNDKPICVLGCFDDSIADTKRLQYLAVHPQNHDRGIEAKFVKLVYDAESKKGVRHFEPVDTELHQIMRYYELLSVKT